MTKYARGKVKFKEILSERFDKPFENISEDDLRQDLITSGRTRADVRDVLQGFRKFKKKDADFTLDEDGGYRINTTQGALRNSGRRKGRKVGQSDLARLMRLGEDVSKFAGYTQSIAEQINIPEVIEASVEKEIDPELDFNNIFEGINPLAQGPAKSSTTGKTGSAGSTQPKKEVEKEVEEEKGPFMDRDILGIRAKEKVRKESQNPTFVDKFKTFSDTVNDWLQKFRPRIVKAKPDRNERSKKKDIITLEEFMRERQEPIVDLTEYEIAPEKRIPTPPIPDIFGQSSEERERGITVNTFKKGGKIQGAESGIESKMGPLETPYAAIDHNLGRFIWQDQKEDSPLMFDGTYFNAKEGKPYPVKSMKTIDDTSELAYRKKGGKLPKYGDGAVLPQNSISRSTPSLGNAFDTQFTGQEVIENMQPQTQQGGDLYEAIKDLKQGDSYETKGITDKQGLNLNDLLYYGATVGLPFGKAIQSTIMMNRLKDKLVSDLQSPDLNVGVVRDIRRPEQSIKYNPTTTDVGAENANRQFQLAQNRAQRFAFDAGQDESKIRQEEAVRENQNRQRMMDAEIGNKKKGIASQLAAQRYFTELGQRNQAVIGGAETIADIGMQNQYVRSMKQMELAKAMMRKGNIEGAKRLLGIRKNGGRLTKFSKNASK
jgi:hypothetical protein